MSEIITSERELEHTHGFLVHQGYRWLRRIGCGFAFKEFVAATNTGEIPDAIGFSSTESILVEVKVSRSDFLADRKKFFRAMPEQGMGMYRYYLCPKGLIRPEELPDRWGLIYQTGSNLSVIVNKTWRGHVRPKEWRIEHNADAERAVLYSALRRLELRNLISTIYKPVSITLNNAIESSATDSNTVLILEDQ
jgi:hypothetical protein